MDYQASLHHEILQKIVSRVEEDAKRILYLGTSPDDFASALKACREGVEVWTIVPQSASRRSELLDRWLVGDIEAMEPLPLPSDHFDCLVCDLALSRVHDPEQLLKRIRLHLRSGASVICHEANVAHWTVVADLLQGQFRYGHHGIIDRTSRRFFTPKSLSATLWDGGYMVIHAESSCAGNPAPAKAIGAAVTVLGLTRHVVEDALSVHQQLFVARPAPDPFKDPGKMAGILGPHMGTLGPATKRCSVIVLTYNSMSTIDTCLSSLLPNLGSDDELILVDNASRDGTQGYLETCDHPAVRVFLNERNLGFAAGCNIGLLQSHGQYPVLLNPDTRVSCGWLDGLIAPFTENGVGAVGPISNNVCGDQFIGRDVGMTPARATGTISTKLLVGFCLALRRDLLDRFGLLDEGCFLGADDLELSWRLRILGFGLRVANEVFVQHQAGVSFGSLEPGQKSDLVAKSDRALIMKLRRYYGPEPLLVSSDLWGSDIFAEALGRPD